MAVFLLWGAVAGPGCTPEIKAPAAKPTSAARPPTPLKEQVIRIPLPASPDADSRRLSLEATVYRPEGAGPSPLLALSHGTPRDSAERRLRQRYEAQSRALVKMGFCVVIPMRRGYGHSDGDYAEEEGLCEQAQYYEAAQESAGDLLAAVRYLQAQPDINPRQVVLAGHSSGGFASLALAGQGFPGLLGVISFAGGRGSRADRVCNAPTLIAAFARFGRTARVPTLWIYAENDTFFRPSLVRQLYLTYTRAGGQAQLVMLPPFSAEGHFLFPQERGVPLWQELVQAFVARLGIPPLAAIPVQGGNRGQGRSQEY